MTFIALNCPLRIASCTTPFQPIWNWASVFSVLLFLYGIAYAKPRLGSSGKLSAAALMPTYISESGSHICKFALLLTMEVSEVTKPVAFFPNTWRR